MSNEFRAARTEQIENINPVERGEALSPSDDSESSFPFTGDSHFQEAKARRGLTEGAIDFCNRARTPGWAPAILAPEIFPSLPGYEILAIIAEGGMGVVYRARNFALNRIEAVKMVKAAEFAGPRELARFAFEVEACAGLEHPNIVTLYDVGEVGNRPFIAMRWIEGSNLAECRPTSLHGDAALMAKVAHAVHFAHQRGILHRDLKPQNILLDVAGEPYVADFGVARRIESGGTITQAGGLVGTPLYMSPEQARGEGNLTVASDVYSLGVMLYELIAGSTPFAGQSHMEVLKQVLESEPLPPRAHKAAIDPDLEAICMKCLEKKPGDRYASAADLALDLERYLNGEPVSARSPGLWDFVRQIWRTRPDTTAYAWQVLTWFGALILPSHLAVFGLARAEASVGWVWLVQLANWCGFAVVIWWYLLRRFRRLPMTERHSTMIAVAHMVGHLGLLIAIVPFTWNASANEALRLYPPLFAISGMGFMIVGSTHWGRFVPIGVAVMMLVPLAALGPAVSPALYAVIISAIMWYWAHALGITFATRSSV